MVPYGSSSSDFEAVAPAGAAPPPVPSERPPQDIEMTSPQQLPQESLPSEFGVNSEFHPMSSATVEQSTFLYRKYEKVKTLGKGAFGTAVLLSHRRTGHLVVSKQVWVQEMPRVELSKVERRTNQPSVKA